MKKERKSVAVALIQANEGQLEWLPKNPRQWTRTDIDLTAKSIAEDEDFLEDRPLLLVPNGDGFVVFAGNLRREGAVLRKLKEVPAIVYYPEDDKDKETIKRRAMKDNGSYGSWDYDELANNWDDNPLGDWGIPAWKAPVYEPNLKPIDGVAPVTDDDINKAQEHLNDNLNQTDKDIIEISCPHCGGKFTIRV